MAAMNEPEDTRAEAPDGTYFSRSRLDENDPNYNPYLAFAGIFENDPFMDDIDAGIEAERQRQRDEAARLADLEDATGTSIGKEDNDVTATSNSSKNSRGGDSNSAHALVANDETSAASRNKYMAFAGMFESSPFTSEVDAYIQAERQRQRDEAAAEADREDAAKAAAEAD
ncbi:MAG: hypothetical protein M3Y74_04785 [Chloroflexota bacterium]|nr:hypothetical protein [Chloroflexota bacterium]